MSSAETTFSQDYLNPWHGALLLQKLPIFSEFSQRELERIYALGEIRVYRSDTNILIEGESSVGMYLVLEGQVGVYKSGKTGQDEGHLLTHLGPASCFGEMSFIDNKPRSATVTTQTRVVVYYLDGPALQGELADNAPLAHRFYANFARVLSTRLRELDEQYILSQKQLWKHALSRRGDDSECQNSQKSSPSPTR
ncbi:MAG: Crp/Fnr family transcriptional regulator [Silvanigrellaceae bacterium]